MNIKTIIKSSPFMFLKRKIGEEIAFEVLKEDLE
jgi:hypothetical protein